VVVLHSLYLIYKSWEQWHLHVVVNNTPRPVSDDCAAVIERQRIQVRTIFWKLCWQYQTYFSSVLFCTTYCVCPSCVDCASQPINWSLSWCRNLGYCRRNATICSDEGIRNSGCIYWSRSSCYVWIRNKLYQKGRRPRERILTSYEYAELDQPEQLIAVWCGYKLCCIIKQ